MKCEMERRESSLSNAAARTSAVMVKASGIGKARLLVTTLLMMGAVSTEVVTSFDVTPFC